MLNKERVLITGASGFVGKSLLSLLDTERYEVLVLTRNPQKFAGNATVQVVTGDLMDLSSLKTALNGVSILINMAAEIRNQEKLEATNVGGTKNMLAAIKQTPTLTRIVHLSSVGVVGMNFHLDGVVVDEAFSPAPKNEYERTKLISEQLFLDYFRKSSLNWSVLRPTNVFGPHHPFDALLNLMQYVQQGKQLMFTPSACVNYVYVDDLSASIVHCLNAPENAVFNVGSSMRLSKFLTLCAAELQTPLKSFKLPKVLVRMLRLLKIRKLDAVSNAVEYSDKALLKQFSYPVGIEEGIKRTIAHYKQTKKLS